MIRVSCLVRRAAILFGAAVTATQACSDDIRTNPTPSITVSISPGSATVAPGGSVDVTATLTGSGGFTGSGATFALTGAPAGVTYTVSNFQTRGAITTATITIFVAVTVAPGSYPMNLIGSGTGVSSVSVAFTLTVPMPTIALSINPTTATVGLGGSVAIGATLTGSAGFTGAGATFALTGAPGGVTFAVSNLLTSGSVTTATVTILVAATVAPGMYTINLIGSGAGVKTVSVSFALTVDATPAPLGFTLSANPVTLTTCEGCAAVTANITINRSSGFSGSVALSVSNSPVDQGATFTMALDPTNTTGNNSILTVTTNAAPGNYTLTITGTAQGFATQTVTIAVTVQ
jgi:hypothetical protein